MVLFYPVNAELKTKVGTDGHRPDTKTVIDTGSLPAVSMDRWQSPNDNRYARNAGVSIRYKNN